MKDIFKLKDSANIGINKLMMDGNRVFFQGSKNTLKKRGERGWGVMKTYERELQMISLNMFYV